MDPRFYNISHRWTQHGWSMPYVPQPRPSSTWADSLDNVQLEMILQDILEQDLKESDCSSARNLLSDIGIRC